MKTKSILNLTKDDALTELNKLLQFISKQTNIPCKLDPAIDIKEAGTEFDDNDLPQIVKIGTYQIHNAAPEIFHHKVKNLPENIVLRMTQIPDMNFIFPVLNAHHEYVHIIQKTQLYRKTEMAKAEQYQLLHELARMDNYEYYHENYYQDPNEIQAEQYGINGAYQYMCDVFPHILPEQHEQLILSAVNYKMKNFDYWVKQQPFASLDEANTAFNKAYEKSLRTDKDFNVYTYSDNNIVKQFIKMHDETMGAYGLTKTPFEQVQCIATINMEIHKDSADWISHFPALKSMNMNYENDIYKPGKIAIRNPVQRQEDEINMQLGRLPPDDEFLEKQKQKEKDYAKIRGQLAEQILNISQPSDNNENDYDHPYL